MWNWTCGTWCAMSSVKHLSNFHFVNFFKRSSHWFFLKYFSGLIPFMQPVNLSIGLFIAAKHVIFSFHIIFKAHNNLKLMQITSWDFSIENLLAFYAKKLAIKQNSTTYFFRPLFFSSKKTIYIIHTYPPISFLLCCLFRRGNFLWWILFCWEDNQSTEKSVWFIIIFGNTKLHNVFMAIWLRVNIRNFLVSHTEVI